MKDLVIEDDVLGMLQCYFFLLSFWETDDVRKHSQNHNINSSFCLQLLFSLLIIYDIEMFFTLHDM